MTVATLLLMLVALATGFVAAGLSLPPLRTRRAAFARAFAWNLVLFNLLITAGLAYRFVLAEGVPAGATAALLSALTALKLAWLCRFASLGVLAEREAIPPEVRRGAVAAGGVLWLAVTVLLALPPLFGLELAPNPTLAGFETMLLLAALVAASAMLHRQRQRALSPERGAFLVLAAINLGLSAAILCVFAVGLAFGSVAARLAPFAGAAGMLAYNLLLMGWARRHGPALAPPGPPAGPDPTLMVELGITAREAEIVALICQGLRNKEIAERLFISLQTVKDHNHSIFRKASVRSRVELINRVRGEIL